METTADQVRSFVMSLAVHALIVLVIGLGLWWTRSVRPIQAAGPIIEATLMNVAPSKPKSAPKPPKPEVKPPDQKQAPVPPRGEDKETQEQIDRMALEKAQKAEREQKEKIAKQQQVLEQEQTQMDLEKRKQLDDIRKRLEAAEKKRMLEQEKLKQLEDLAKQEAKPQVPAPPQPPARPPGNAGPDDDALGRYSAALQDVVTANWLRPESAQPGLRCTLDITQIPGGEVIEVHVTSPCNADEITRRSIEAAVQRAQPLPYAGYEKVFQRKIKFNFHYDG